MALTAEEPPRPKPRSHGAAASLKTSAVVSVAPVRGGTGEGRPCLRYPHLLGLLGRPGLEQQNLHARLLGEPRGQHASGRSTADVDPVVGLTRAFGCCVQGDLLSRDGPAVWTTGRRQGRVGGVRFEQTGARAGLVVSERSLDKVAENEGVARLNQTPALADRSQLHGGHA